MPSWNPLSQKSRYERMHEENRSAGWVNRQLNRSPLLVPVAVAVVGLVLGAGGFALANSQAPPWAQMVALMLISVAAVLLLFALGGLASALIVALFGGGEDKDKR